MEPVTTAIMSAIAAGATMGLTDTANKAIADAYDSLKTLIRRKFGGDSNLVGAVAKLEEDPESPGWRDL